MAKQCDHCGKILPGDAIRFCSGCGKRVTSSRPPKKSFSEDPPAWMKQLETSLTNKRYNVPLRESNVKVWDEEETRQLILPESRVDSVGDDPDQDDALPTSPLMVVSSPGIDFNIEMTSHDQIEDIETRPHVAQPRSISHEIAKPIHQQRQGMQAPTDVMHNPAIQIPVTPVPLPQSSYSPVQPARQTPPVMPVPPLAKTNKNNRMRLVIVVGLLFILLLGAVIAWVTVTQPFAVAVITKTTQPFNSTSLGVSLQYPQNWAVVVNMQHGTVIFYDANHTDQVNITVVVAGSQSLNQYMSKSVSSLGMTGQKTLAELSFAGATWQQIQGNVQQSGANYTAMLLATTHGEHYYTILQLAPSTTYPLEEQLVFSNIRSSFQF